MTRHRARPPSSRIDAATAERLLAGCPLGDLADEHRPLGQLLATARAAPTPEELQGSAAAAAVFVTAHASSRRTRARSRSVASLAFAAAALVATTGTAVAATQGALPGPAQRVAHAAFGAVGIRVPEGPRHQDTPAPTRVDTAGSAPAREVSAPRPGASEPAATSTVHGATAMPSSVSRGAVAPGAPTVTPADNDGRPTTTTPPAADPSFGGHDPSHSSSRGNVATGGHGTTKGGNSSRGPDAGPGTDSRGGKGSSHAERSGALSQGK